MGYQMGAAVLNFTGGRANWGCQATSIGLYRFLKHVLNPQGFTKIDTIPYPPSHLQDVWHQKIHGKRIRRILASQDPSLADLKFLEGLCRSRFRHYVDIVKNADVVFFQGEGTMGASKL